MNSDSSRSQRISLVLLFMTLFALVSRGTLMSSDEGGIFNSAAALTHGSLAVPPGENVHPGRDGQLYSLREILPTVLTVPFFVTGVLVDRIFASGAPPLAAGPRKVGIELLDASNWPLFVTTTFMGSLCGALTLLFCYDFLLREGLTSPRALLLVLIVGWASPLVVYAKTIFPQILESAILMLCFLLARQWREAPGLRQGWKLGLACGLGLLARPAFLPVIVCFGGFVLCVGELPKRERLRALVAFCLPCGAAVGLVLLVNSVKWGSPLDFGYHDPRESFSTNPLLGLAGLLISPGAGLFFFAPMMLVPLLYLRTIWRAGPHECALGLAVTAVYLGIYGQWYDWHGGLCWGPRFLLALMAPWMALAGRVLAAESNSFGRRLVAVTAVLGGVVNFFGVTVYPHWIWRHTHPQPFSLTDSQIVRTVQVFWQRGADDLWIVSAAEKLSAGYLGAVVLLLVLLAGALTGIRKVPRTG